ncbi:MAG: phosphoribosylformylglycinamidine cyclo-ligase [Candidatus Rokuibacteriota bacterium]|nr:MAG: phosphoribosylformylglycinamidine cyclo-ligase [Candidatus Rokubacteria bacterium]
MKPLTYREAGVDIDAGEDAVRRIAPLARATNRPEVIGGIGGFASFVSVPSKFREPVLVSSTDGVGTKLQVAFLAGRHDTVGIDLVAMGVNDILVHGAEPLYFLDYIAVGRLDPAQIETIVGGVAEGCRQAGCALVGGEMAEHGAAFPPGEYDLAGFAVGVAERGRLIDGSRVRPGDVVLGLASSGLHSNGFTLARRIVFDVMGLRVSDRFPGTGRLVADEMLEPTRIYVRSIQTLLEAVEVRAMVHVTGGGLTGARISRSTWSPPEVFRTLREAGRVDEGEMFKTFNMGIGYVVIVAATAGETAARTLRESGETVIHLGEITAGERGAELVA